MLKSQKSQLTCSYCSKIFRDPILLPCEDSIFREHLSERDVVKQNKIKCNKCKQEFQVKSNKFKSHNELKKLAENQSYLSGDAISRKQELEVSIRKLFEFYDDFVQKRTQIDLDVYNHFQELCFQIDQHREGLKKRIDDIALEMIDKIKKHEEIYLKELKKSLSSFDDSQSRSMIVNHVR
jgi:hypothetical protein